MLLSRVMDGSNVPFESLSDWPKGVGAVFNQLTPFQNIFQGL